MSHTARDLLVRGTAAALAKSYDEARFYLEWVLRTDATSEQRADAHYGLSISTDGPEEKRTHLESVLAINPHYPEARRDLAVLEGRIRADEIIDHREPAEPIDLPRVIADGLEDPQKCSNCGAQLRARLGDAAVTCQFCGTLADEYKSGTIEEQDWTAAIHTKRGHSWVLPTERALECRSCGAQVSITPAHISVECLFCGGSYVIKDAAPNLIEPEGIVPFGFDADKALEYAQLWLREQSFRPQDLDELAAFSRPQPIYLPFWTFDIEGEVRWTGVVAQSEYGGGVIRGELGSRLLSYDDLLVPATHSLPADLLKELGFDTASLVAYDPRMLADWSAELYSISAADASIEALHSVYSGSREMVRASEGGDNLQVERPQVTISNYKLVLLPVWITQYSYRGQRFSVAINGSSGETHGNLPRNAFQRFLSNFTGG